MDEFDPAAPPGVRIEGYASLFGAKDQAGDVVARGAFAASLGRTGAAGVKMLFQHVAEEPVGVWEEIAEDDAGLFVRGRIDPAGPRGRAALQLVTSGAVDGLSIGFRPVRESYDDAGARVLLEIDLWEVSIVTFPMLPQARLVIAPEDASGPVEPFVPAPALEPVPAEA
jgi:HK97 family phage prohead protease